VSARGAQGGRLLRIGGAVALGSALLVTACGGARQDANEPSGNFKVQVLKLPLSAPQSELNRLWYSRDPADQTRLEAFAKQYASLAVLNNKKWYKLDEIAALLPKGTLTSENAGSRREGRLARTLVATQVAAVTVLMFAGVLGAILATRVLNLDPGYDPSMLRDEDDVINPLWFARMASALHADPTPPDPGGPKMRPSIEQSSTAAPR